MKLDELRTAAGNAMCGGDLKLPHAHSPGSGPAEQGAELLQILAIKSKVCEADLQTEQRFFRNEAGFSGPPCPWNGTIPALDDKGRKQALAKFRKARPTSDLSDEAILKPIENAHAKLANTCLTVRTNQHAFENLVVGCAKQECFEGAGPDVLVTGFSNEALIVDALKQVRVATRQGAITTEQLVQHTVDVRRREDLVVGLELYLSSFTGPRQAIHEVTYREIALMHDEALDKSETSLQISHSTQT